MTVRKNAPRAKTRWFTVGFVVAAMMLLFASVTFGNLVGSTFEGNDGNLLVTTAGNTDWVNAPNRNEFIDLPSGTGDNSLGQGAKESISCPTVVSGSIPPNKSDLTRFYVASETGANGHFYLYLAWERSNILGNANMDFEFNQSTTLCANSNLIPTRTAGDLLILYDFVNGGGNPVLSVREWTGSAWGPAASVVSEAKVNDVTVTDPIAPDAPRSLPALTFGEAALDLTASNIIGVGECAPFASAYLKSRSAASFPAELKDFIAPHATSLSNCGAVAITKDNGKGAALQGAVFSITDADGNEVGPVTTDADGKACVGALSAGAYTVTETSAPTGYALDPDSQTVTVTGSSGDCDTATAVSFSDTPLTDLVITATGEAAPAGTTNSQITCTDANGVDIGNSPTGNTDPASVAANGLEPGVYTCVVTIDP
jgi:hypothetical protein